LITLNNFNKLYQECNKELFMGGLDNQINQAYGVCFMGEEAKQVELENKANAFVIVFCNKCSLN